MKYLNIPDISIEEFDSLCENHSFSKRYTAMKKSTIQAHKKKRASQHTLSRIAAILAFCLIFSTGAYAAVSHSAFFQNVFGDSARKDVVTHEETVTDSNKTYTVQYPNRDYVSINPDDAEEILGEFMMDEPVTKQIQDHKLTVLSAVRDKHIMVMEFTLEREGGVTALSYNQLTNEGKGAVTASNATFSFGMKNGFDCIFVDPEKSTPDKYYCYDYIVFDKPIPAGQTPVINIRMSDIPFSEITVEDMWNMSFKEEEFAIPVEQTIPASIFSSEQEGILQLSPLGFKIDMTKGLGLSKKAALDPGSLDSISIQFYDNSEYIVFHRTENVDNTSYLCGFSDGTISIVFNRMVNVNAIETITVNDIVYTLHP